jgi:hypothetical protein
MPLTKSQRLIKYFKDNKIALSFGKNWICQTLPYLNDGLSPTT